MAIYDMTPNEEIIDAEWVPPELSPHGGHYQATCLCGASIRAARSNPPGMLGNLWHTYRDGSGGPHDCPQFDHMTIRFRGGPRDAQITR